jgi:hypothetical protein
VLAVFASFAPALSNDFVNWDDDLNLTGNAEYRGLSASHLRWMLTTTLGGHFQPLTWLSWALDYTLFGMDPRGYHLTNLVLHTANALLVWLVLREILEARAPGSERVRARVAAVGALLFAIHPLRVESVAWATERRDVLSGFFWLLALLAYLRTERAPAAERRRGHALVLGALALSLAAKAWGMTFPLVLLILDAYPLGRLARAPRAALREKIPVALLAAVGAAVAFLAQRSVPEMRSLAAHGLGARVAQGAYGLCFYLVKTLVPLGLHPARLLEPHLDPAGPRYVLAMLAVVTLTVVAVLERERRPWLLATWAAYLVIVSPVLGFAQTGPQLVADRYTYLACLPWVALATAGAASLAARATAPGATYALRATSAALLVVLGTLTFRQTRVWHDSMTLWDHTLRLDPCNWMALTNRGFARADRAAAIADYSAAIRCNPDYYLPYFNRGNARQDEGDFAGAAADHSRVIALRPENPSAYNNRGWARQSMGDFAGAVADYERALALAPPDWRPRAMVSANLAAARARGASVDR